MTKYLTALLLLCPSIAIAAERPEDVADRFYRSNIYPLSISLLSEQKLQPVKPLLTQGLWKILIESYNVEQNCNKIYDEYNSKLLSLRPKGSKQPLAYRKPPLIESSIFAMDNDGADRHKITSSTISNDHATVIVDMIYERNNTNPPIVWKVKLKMIRSENSWKIYDFIGMPRDKGDTEWSRRTQLQRYISVYKKCTI
jgi:hypothetical protein